MGYKNSSLKTRESFDYLHNLIFSLLVCLPCAILCVLLCQNEIYLDDWYIEASANGFFGADNRSVWVLGANIILTGLIYLLSFTGIRLFWLHIILIAVNYLSHVLITMVLVRNRSKFYATVASVLFGLVMGPLVYFEYQFTTTAAFGIAAGCVFMLDAVKHRRKGDVWFATFWIILSSGIRFDAIYYSMAFMGTFWLFQNVPALIKAKKDKALAKEEIKSILKTRLVPFVITLVICFGVEFTYRFAMDLAVPGFREYNSVRTQVDDCNMPDYDDYREAYESINLSENDYNLMLAWNNMDPEFFTQEKLEQILEIAENANAEKEAPGENLLKRVWNSASKNAAIWVVAIGLIYALSASDGKMMWCCIAMAGIALVFYAYFLSIGRLIWRTEWPIWIVINCALVLLLCEAKPVQAAYVQKYVVPVLLAVVMFFYPFANSNSLYARYKARSVDPDSVLVYLHERIVNQNVLCYETYCRYAATEIVSDKENFYFALGSPHYWLQQYPMPAIDTFRFNEIGDGENWGTLGQYFALLPQVTRAYNKYGIDNPFRDLVNENVRVTGRAAESYHRMKSLYTYLEEHYYDDVSFSVEKILHNNEAIVARFIANSPMTDGTELTGSLEAAFAGHTTVPRMVCIKLNVVDVPIYDINSDDAYVCIRNENGEKHIFSVYDYDPSKVIIFDDTLTVSETYTVDFMFENADGWYYVENCGELHMPDSF